MSGPPVDPDPVRQVIDELLSGEAGPGVTLAVVVVHGGEVLDEGYGVAPDTIFGPGEPVTADTALTSWSMAKSITHAAVGILVGDGLLDPAAPAPVRSWHDTPKSAITLQHLLEMRPGLRFVEDYVDGEKSHCIDMLFGDGAGDHAAYAAALPLDHEPGTVWNYSSGTTNIVARIIADTIAPDAPDGGEAAVRDFLRQRLFEPIGMHSATPRFDPSGTFVGSSYVYATARDFARFGELYLHDGVWDGQRVLPEGWAEHAARQIAVDAETGFGYGAHWWTWPSHPGLFAAHGYEGQYTVVVPDHDLVMVHLGKWDAADRHHVVRCLKRIIEAVPKTRVP